MNKHVLNRLSRRERQIMDVIYRQGEATADEVHKSMPDPPSYSAVRALLVVLEEKGLVRHKKRGRAYLYIPTISQHQARESALRHMVKTFFDGSVAGVMAALVNLSNKSLSDEDLVRLEQLVKNTKNKKRQKK